MKNLASCAFYTQIQMALHRDWHPPDAQPKAPALIEETDIVGVDDDGRGIELSALKRLKCVDTRQKTLCIRRHNLCKNIYDWRE